MSQIFESFSLTFHSIKFYLIHFMWKVSISLTIQCTHKLRDYLKTSDKVTRSTMKCSCFNQSKLWAHLVNEKRFDKKKAVHFEIVSIVINFTILSRFSFLKYLHQFVAALVHKARNSIFFLPSLTRKWEK